MRECEAGRKENVPEEWNVRLLEMEENKMQCAGGR